MKKGNKLNNSTDIRLLVQKFSVPLMFIIICAICIPLSGLSANMLINEIVTRIGRNAFLILSLLIPIMAGMGLNFGMTLGAMAAEIALIFVSDWQIVGIPGMVLAAIVSVPISVLLGIFCGKILNEAKGREMITSYIMSFFVNGIYQLVVLYLMGSIIPIKHGAIKLPRGYGIRNTVSLLSMRQKLDNLLAINVGGVKIPVLTFIIIALLCLFIVWFSKTKLGQDMRAVGQDMDVARDAGINVERTRIISIVMSTVLAGFGMIIYLQNMGNIATYSAHSQIGMFCIAALLVGGASVDRASIGNVFLGVILFHTMFIVAPKAGAAITGDSMIGEYFRVFVSYAVITIALVMYETNIVIILAVAAVMFVIGRGHTIYFDNKETSYNGQTVEAFYKVTVTTGEEKPSKLSKGDRGMASIMGQTLSMTLEITDAEGDQPHAHKVSMKVPYGMDGITINIPALMAGLPQDAYLSEFVIEVPDTGATDEEIVTDEFDMGADM